jgi:predicted nuclease with TOPRIM domain
LGTLQTEHEASTNQALDAEDKLRSLSRELESMRRDRSLVDEKAQNRAQQVDELNDQLARMQLEIETLNKVGHSFVEYNRESR